MDLGSPDAAARSSDHATAETSSTRPGVLQKGALSSKSSGPAVSGPKVDPGHGSCTAELAFGADAPPEKGKGGGKGKDAEGHRSHPYVSEPGADFLERVNPIWERGWFFLLWFHHQDSSSPFLR